MKSWKLLGLVTVTFFLVAVGGMLMASSISATSASAQGKQEQVGRYQISAWASYAGAKVHHSGYYILDTVTGKVVDSGHEIHGIGSGPEGKKEEG
ncbi:hypothetical protein A7E78_04610 [Syntrophotalea acetylenivorans]|uniref:Uncharacterized protein n=1 Tax=Syntrophotalea acetylenivorans TaxID=1842532 RepID=A0A1L3GML3_9BACT|nr:hypothetical protein [Syntrophotalea acetylenivorans]APG27177.1 hypothetical protein A7E78_04610 [Syntrophotalea acetylenivorans]